MATPFKIGQGSPANTFLAVWMAEEAGLFKANNLDMSIVPMTGGRESGPSFRAGLINLMHIGMSSVVRANTKGHDLVTIGSLSNVVRGDFFGAPGITTPEQLRGGIVGISSTGSETDSTTTLALRKIGLDRTDVTIKEVGSTRLRLVRNGEIQATTLGEPDRSAARAEGLPCLVELFASRIPWVYSGLVASRSYVAVNRPQVLAAMRAIIEGNALACKDAARAKAVLARELKISDLALLDQSYANFKEATPEFAAASLEGAENILSVLNIAGMSKNSTEYLDGSIHEDLKREGFLDEIARKYA
ncbi:MAG: hypothetical protein RLZ98_935 [Pseudomonadota bacterium]|jgi:NitT/TauT family transport system substrate-binding protein